MSRFKLKNLIFIFLLIAAVALSGCNSGSKGDTGPTGPAGPAGADVDPATVDNLQAQIDALAGTGKLETCNICHKDVSAEEHQDIYNEYTDASDLTLTIDNVASVDNGDGTFDTTVTFSVALNGSPVVNLDDLDTYRFGYSNYDSTTGTFPVGGYIRDTVAATATPGQFTATGEGLPFAPNLSNGQVYGYAAVGELETEGMTLYDNVANVGIAYGNEGTYVSAANVTGCEKCHGTPYMKHGYRAPEVAGLPDFASCKICHFDTGNGGHQDWQIMVDNPVRYAEIHEGDPKTDAEKTKYAYKKSIMNDVHMSHAMEFPYPQSMANCATCHEGKLTTVLDNSNFAGTTCRSCHALEGDANYPDPKRAPSLKSLWVAKQVDGFHSITSNCTVCHDASTAPEFSEYHTGYDSVIYADATGTRYSDIFTTTINSASLSGNTLTVNFSTTAAANTTGIDVADVDPTLMVGLYGYDTKDYVVGPHRKTVDSSRDLEFGVDDTNPRGTVTATATAGAFTATVDLSNWADLIADGTVSRAEIAVTPALPHPTLMTTNHSGDVVPVSLALNAPSRTFDLVTNAFDDDFYDDIVDVETGCNTCHDALGTTFHSGDRGGNYTVCRMCHTSIDDSSHLEMQSRAGYAHAIHSFQAFDIGDIDFTDPVEKTKYELHIEHTFPNFTIKNCEACHFAGKYDVPDQMFSLPGYISKSDTVTTWDRNIGAVPAYVVGPASYNCGACHRAHEIKEDEAGGLAAWNQHTQDNGYLIEVADDTEANSVLDSVIEKIMAYFY